MINIFRFIGPTFPKVGLFFVSFFIKQVNNFIILMHYIGALLLSVLQIDKFLA